MPPLNIWIQLEPHASRNTTQGSGAQTLQPGFNGATLRVDCTTGTPATPFTGFTPAFSDPAMQLVLRIAFSWDGGATFPEKAEVPVNGSVTGSWGTDKHGNPVMAPTIQRGIPFNSVLGGRPNAYSAELDVVNGPVDFGLSLMEW